MHLRKDSLRRKFEYRVFMFYLDLDELETINKKIKIFGLNKFNYFNFRDSDHLQISTDSHASEPGLKNQIITYLNQNGINQPVGRIMLLTNLATLGYQFNPVSFYFVYDDQDNPICSLAEVGNTFGEIKPYLIESSNLQNNTFIYRTKKLFYVSPFINHDVDFYFNLRLPDEKLKLRIDDYKEENRFFTATLEGKKEALNNKNLTLFAFLFPLITLKIIFLIHWEAFRIWMKKVPYLKKDELPELQVGVYNKKVN
ncbi:MAG: DUF1365 domain-containing protein [Cyclobacteriaceae bacterium]